MNKRWGVILAAWMLLALSACGAAAEPVVTQPVVTEPAYTDPIPQEPEITLETLAGWWTKPEWFDGITGLHTFCVEPDSETLTSYDSYGRAVETMDCWYDVFGFNVDAGDFFGEVTYVYDEEDETLTDELGNVEYVRCDPIDPASAPVQTEALLGTWYKNGQTDEGYERIVLEEAGYHTEQYDIETGYGIWNLAEVTGYYNDSEYSGPALELEAESGFMTADPWVLESGKVLYDAFHEEYYIHESVSGDEWTALCGKYDLLRTGWYAQDDDTALSLTFFGEVLYYANDGTMPATIGYWSLEESLLYIVFDNGDTQELEDTGEIIYADMLYIRGEIW